MRVFESFTDFADTVDLITCPETLRTYGLSVTSSMGAFLRRQYQELVDFCKEHPEFHIVSCQTSAVINRPEETAWTYFLALGDSDPRIYCILPISEIRHRP